MYLVKLTRDGTDLCNKVCRSLIAFYVDHTLEIATSIIRVPNQEEFFNMRPLLKKAEELAFERVNVTVKEEPEEGVICWSLSEPQNVQVLETDMYLSIKQDNQDLIKLREANIVLLLGVERVAPNEILPFILMAGAKNYQDYAYIYGFANRLITQHGDKLSNMDMDMIEERDQKSATDILEELNE